MSFLLQYRRLVTVSVEDEAGAALPAFTFAPAPQTRRLLEDHQLTFRPRPAGFEVFYRVNPRSADPLVGRIARRIRLTFPFALGEPDFFERHEPGLSAATGPQLYLDNLTPAGVIQPAAVAPLTAGDVTAPADAMKVHPRTFVATAEAGAGAATTFRVRDKFAPAAAPPLLEAPIVAVAGATQAAARIDLSARPPGPYTLETDAPGAARRTIYVDDDLAGVPMAGLIDLYWETAQNTAPVAGVPYVVRFRKR
jgi:hypothetical protein